MYITPSGTRKRFLNEDKIAVVNTENGEQIEGTVKDQVKFYCMKLL